MGYNEGEDRSMIFAPFTRPRLGKAAGRYSLAVATTHRRYCPKGKRRQRRAGIRRMRAGWSRLRVGAVARLLYGKSARKAFLLWSTGFLAQKCPRSRRTCRRERLNIRGALPLRYLPAS